MAGKSSSDKVKKIVDRLRAEYDFHIPPAMYHDTTISFMARSIFVFLRELRPKQKWGQYIEIKNISYDFIKERIGIKRDETLRKYLRELQSHGWIDIIRRPVKEPLTYRLYPVKQER